MTVLKWERSRERTVRGEGRGEEKRSDHRTLTEEKRRRKRGEQRVYPSVSR